MRDPRFLLFSAAGTVLVAAAIGIPTDILPNPWYTRMTAVEGDQYLWWLAVSLLSGMLLATYLLSWGSGAARHSGVGSGVLGYLAIGCPICNKLVVAMLGTSGALSYFAPLQPLLGLLAVLLAAVGLLVRLRGIALSCSAGAASASAS